MPRWHPAGVSVLALVAIVLAGCTVFPFGSRDADDPLPYPGGCAEFELSERRCAAIVQALAERAQLDLAEATSIQLLGDPGCGDGLDPNVLCTRTTSFVVRVRFWMSNGSEVDEPLFCGVGGQFSIMCTDTPEINVWTTASNGYFDVPCAGDVPDSCATRFPAPEPAAAAAERELVVRRLEIPITRVGAQTIDVGQGTLANGLLDEAAFRLVDGSEGKLLFGDSGIGLVIESLEPDGRPFDNYYLHGRRDGIERFRAHLEIEILWFEPGAVIVLEDIVVR